MTGFYDQYKALGIGLLVIVCMGLGYLIWWGNDHDYFARAKTGYVTSMRFDPAHTVRHDGDCAIRDKSGLCTMHWPDTYEHVPDRWFISLRNCEDYKRCVTGKVQVAQEDFVRYRVGGHYPDQR